MEGKVGDVGRIYRLCHTMDKLQSQFSQSTIRHKQRSNMKRAFRRLHLKVHILPPGCHKKRPSLRRARWRLNRRIRNLTREAHRQAANHLCRNYDVILLPRFGVAKMVRRRRRRINKDTTRQMLQWSHYQFRQLLIRKVCVFRLFFLVLFSIFSIFSILLC
jgi:putative transposase